MAKTKEPAWDNDRENFKKKRAIPRVFRENEKIWAQSITRELTFIVGGHRV
jgi:hypothetical protein